MRKQLRRVTWWTRNEPDWDTSANHETNKIISDDNKANLTNASSSDSTSVISNVEDKNAEHTATVSFVQGKLCNLHQ